jgi:hypothetical protein
VHVSGSGSCPVADFDIGSVSKVWDREPVKLYNSIDQISVHYYIIAAVKLVGATS